MLFAPPVWYVVLMIAALTGAASMVGALVGLAFHWIKPHPHRHLWRDALLGAGAFVLIGWAVLEMDWPYCYHQAGWTLCGSFPFPGTAAYTAAALLPALRNIWHRIPLPAVDDELRRT